jgi:hypothetical protein
VRSHERNGPIRDYYGRRIQELTDQGRPFRGAARSGTSEEAPEPAKY